MHNFKVGDIIVYRGEQPEHHGQRFEVVELGDETSKLKWISCEGPYTGKAGPVGTHFLESHYQLSPEQRFNNDLKSILE